MQRTSKKKIRYTGQRAVLRKLFFLILLAVGVYCFLQSSIFAVNSIEVNGSDTLKEDEIVKLSNILKQENIFKVDTRAAEEKILLHPLIKEVNIRRHLPQVIKINVIERKPYLLLPFKKGFIEVDREGVYLRYIEQIGDRVLPIITGVDIKDSLTRGKEIESNGLAASLDILGSVKSFQKQQIAEIDVHDNSSIKVYTDTGVEVLMGEDEELGRKIRLAFNILSELDQKVEYVDVRYPASPVIK